MGFEAKRIRELDKKQLEEARAVMMINTGRQLPPNQIQDP